MQVKTGKERRTNESKNITFTRKKCNSDIEDDGEEKTKELKMYMQDHNVTKTKKQKPEGKEKKGKGVESCYYIYRCSSAIEQT